MHALIYSLRDFVRQTNWLFGLMVLKQILKVLDYSRFSRHLLLTAGDDGTVHLWDTTGRNPKVCSFNVCSNVGMNILQIGPLLFLTGMS